ncbi:MAG: CHAT domain-containing protein [Clostridiales bacterium]|nr:CHAT domain-containing protein [Clostridiales bacterium]
MRFRQIAAMLLAVLCLPLSALAEAVIPTEAAAGRVNRALLVGCDRFVSQMDTTPSSANNVEMMAQALAGGTMAPEKLMTSVDSVASIGNLAGLILDAFDQADEDDVSLFYISTHGLWQEAMGSSGMTLLLSDGEKEAGVTARQLRSMFDQIKGTKVLMLDACHAGAMIGKGVNEHLMNVFSGPEYVVICSSGGAEESWFWSGDIDGERLAGAGYFSGTLVRALSAEGGYGADDNRDGSITLTELKRYLLDNHGASVVRTYPEESSFAVFTYDVSGYTGRRRDALVEGVSFESDVLSAQEPTVHFNFNVVSTVQVAYQLVYYRQGRWDFDNAQLIYDNNGAFGTWAAAGGSLSPGMKQRAITIDRAEAEDSGYVLLQLLTIDRGRPAVVCSRVLCVPPESGDPALRVDTPAAFCPGNWEELTFTVAHETPCELTVSIIDMEGKTVRRLSSRQPSRPEKLDPAGTCFTWDGRKNDGDAAADGMYRIRVRAYVGTEKYEFISEPIFLLAMLG